MLKYVIFGFVVIVWIDISLFVYWDSELMLGTFTLFMSSFMFFHALIKRLFLYSQGHVVDALHHFLIHLCQIFLFFLVLIMSGVL